jgi:hypothetical protein
MKVLGSLFIGNGQPDQRLIGIETNEVGQGSIRLKNIPFQAHVQMPGSAVN